MEYLIAYIIIWVVTATCFVRFGDMDSAGGTELAVALALIWPVSGPFAIVVILANKIVATLTR